MILCQEFVDTSAIKSQKWALLKVISLGAFWSESVKQFPFSVCKRNDGKLSEIKFDKNSNNYFNDSLMWLYSSCFSAEEDDQAIMYADVRFTQQYGRQVGQRVEIEVEAEYARVNSSKWPWHTPRFIKSRDVNQLNQCFYTDCTTEGPSREEVMSRYPKMRSFIQCNFPSHKSSKLIKSCLSNFHCFPNYTTTYVYPVLGYR